MEKLLKFPFFSAEHVELFNGIVGLVKMDAPDYMKMPISINEDSIANYRTLFAAIDRCLGAGAPEDIPVHQNLD